MTAALHDECTEALSELQKMHYNLARLKRTPVVLSVEDIELDRQLLRRNLKTAGVQVEIVEVATGEEAVSQLKARLFDILFLDLLLGTGMSGADVLAAAQDVVRKIPIVILTGMQERSPLIIAALDACPDALVARKPLSVEQIKILFGGIR